MQREQIFQRCAGEVASALKINPDQIAPASFLVGDLGAESIDLVDLTFRLERAFDIEIPEGDLFEGTDPTADQIRMHHVVDYLENALNSSAPGNQP